MNQIFRPDLDFKKNSCASLVARRLNYFVREEASEVIVIAFNVRVKLVTVISERNLAADAGFGNLSDP